MDLIYYKKWISL